MLGILALRHRTAQIRAQGRSEKQAASGTTAVMHRLAVHQHLGSFAVDAAHCDSSPTRLQGEST